MSKIDAAGVREWMARWFGFVRDDRLDEAARDFVERFGEQESPQEYRVRRDREVADMFNRVRSAAADPNGRGLREALLGYADSLEVRECPDCNGSGRVPDGFQPTELVCAKCNGKGVCS